MKILYRKTAMPATSPAIPTGCALVLPLLLSLPLAGCHLGSSHLRQAELTGREKIELRDELRTAPGHYEQRQVVDRYREILRRRERDGRLAVQPSAPPPPVFPRPLDDVPALDERELGGIVKERTR